MSFGKTIKALRRNANMTQEQLAELLSLSPQAVSRWETDAAMPDISVLPILCNIFGVSSDKLLGIDVTKKERAIREIIKRAESFHTRGYYEEASAILEEGLQEYPTAHNLMTELMFVSHWQSRKNDTYSPEDCDRFRAKAVALGEKILESCTEDSDRYNAVQTLCFAYRDMGETEKAKSLARSMPPMSISRELLLSRVTEGEERYRAKQCEAYYMIQFLGNMLGGGINTELKTGEWAYTDEEAAALRDKQIAFYDMMFENGDMGFFHCHLVDCHTAQAEYYASVANVQKTLHHLRLAAKHAILFLTDFGEDRTHTSLLLRGNSYGSFSTSDTDNFALRVLETMETPPYDFVRREEEFHAIRASLLPYAQKWEVGQ